MVGDQFAAQFVRLLERCRQLAFRVQGVAEPPEQVANRLQGLVRPVLDRRDDRQEAALNLVQASTGSLTEVGREQQQR